MRASSMPKPNTRGAQGFTIIEIVMAFIISKLNIEI